MNHADFLKYLTRLLPMDPFSTPRKHQKALRFSDIFRGWRGGGGRERVHWEQVG